MVRSREMVHPVHVNENVASTRTNEANKNLAGHATRTCREHTLPNTKGNASVLTVSFVE